MYVYVCLCMYVFSAHTSWLYSSEIDKNQLAGSGDVSREACRDCQGRWGAPDVTTGYVFVQQVLTDGGLKYKAATPPP